MTFNEFEASLDQETVSTAIPPLLQAMWFDAKQDWEQAHAIAQDVENKDGSWVHAYLHRKEGDLGNASYWYSRARRPVPSYSLEQEWEEIVKFFLQSD